MQAYARQYLIVMRSTAILASDDASANALGRGQILALAVGRFGAVDQCPAEKDTSFRQATL